MQPDENGDIVIREGGPEDYPAILDIQHRAYALKEAPLYGDNLPPMREDGEAVAREAEEGKRILVGECAGRVVASMRVKVLEDGAVYWGRLSVDPDMQGRGIGQRMVAGVEEFFPDATAFVLDCGEKSGENFHIYSKFGYVPTGEAFQIENGPRVLVMRKNRQDGLLGTLKP